MTLKKNNWKCIISSCYKSENDFPESDKRLLQQTSFQRLLLSDFNDPKSMTSVDDLSNSMITSNLHIFTFAELQAITHNFSWSNLLGEGGFGPVYKGFVDNKAKPGLDAQPVAVKLLDLNGYQGHKEWLVSLIRFLVYLMNSYQVK